MTTLDLTDWAKRNIWRTSDGQMCVRPGLRRLAAASGGRRFVGGFTVQNPWTLEVWHYVADVSTAGLDLVVRVLDEDFVEWQSIQTGVDVVPRGFSYGVVEGEIMIGSPDMPTLWGFVGGALTLATKVASDNPGTTAINVPRGIVCSVLNRIVIADGAAIFISDPVAVTGGSPRTFVAQNQNQRPGVVFGLHEGAGDSLVAVTSAGVYALDSSAFAVQIVGSNGTPWRLVNRAESYSYDSSCNVKGRVYALTKRGYRLVDTEGGDDVVLDEPSMVLPDFVRIANPDWRSARMYAGEFGPMVAEDVAAGASGPVLHVVDATTGLRSWWSGFQYNTSTNWTARGVLHDPDGADMLIMEDGVYVVEGNCDGRQALTTAAEEDSFPYGLLFARIESDPDDNPTLRRVYWAATDDVRLAIRGAYQIGLGGDTTPNMVNDARCIIINGTTTWGGTGVYQETPLVPASWDCNFNTPDLNMMLSAARPMTRVGPRAVVTLSESAPKRTPVRGIP